MKDHYTIRGLHSPIEDQMRQDNTERLRYADGSTQSLHLARERDRIETRRRARLENYLKGLNDDQ